MDGVATEDAIYGRDGADFKLEWNQSKLHHRHVYDIRGKYEQNKKLY